MNRQEILNSPYGEFMDLLACHSIYEGLAKPKKPKMTMEEFMNLK